MDSRLRGNDSYPVSKGVIPAKAGIHIGDHDKEEKKHLLLLFGLGFKFEGFSAVRENQP
jgi:hypothetical protein